MKVWVYVCELNITLLPYYTVYILYSVVENRYISIKTFFLNVRYNLRNPEHIYPFTLVPSVGNQNKKLFFFLIVCQLKIGFTCV